MESAYLELVIALAGAVINGAVTWGVVSTKLAWLRADVDRAHKRIDALAHHVGHVADA